MYMRHPMSYYGIIQACIQNAPQLLWDHFSLHVKHPMTYPKLSPPNILTLHMRCSITHLQAFSFHDLGHCILKPGLHSHSHAPFCFGDVVHLSWSMSYSFENLLFAMNLSWYQLFCDNGSLYFWFLHYRNKTTMVDILKQMAKKYSKSLCDWFDLLSNNKVSLYSIMYFFMKRGILTLQHVSIISARDRSVWQHFHEGWIANLRSFIKFGGCYIQYIPYISPVVNFTII